ncbi:MAG: ribonuclease Z [Bacteroidales bacterium]
MKFSFTSLGCASALPTVNRFPSAHVLNVHGRLFLIDCGEGCQIQLRKYGFSFLKIREIFISHLHGDHIFGLCGLLSTMSMIGRTADLFIYAPHSFAELLSFFLKFFGSHFQYKIVHIVVSGDEPKVILETKSSQVFSFPLNHRIDCYGYLFREKEPAKNVHKHLIDPHKLTLFEIARFKAGQDVVRENGEILLNQDFSYKPYIPRSFAYCSDTAPFDSLTSYVKNVDLLYHEATFGSDLQKVASETGHSTAAQAANCALEASAKKLLIGHFSSRYKDVTLLLNEARAVFPETYVAKEGTEFEIPLVKLKNS